MLLILEYKGLINYVRKTYGRVEFYFYAILFRQQMEVRGLYHAPDIQGCGKYFGWVCGWFAD
jgi:hypothetical protein